MKVIGVRIKNIRSFIDTGMLLLGEKCNLFIGSNNSGKSTILNSIILPQMPRIDHRDVRDGVDEAVAAVNILLKTEPFEHKIYGFSGARTFKYIYRGNINNSVFSEEQFVGVGSTIFSPTRPNHAYVPFLSKRKTVSFNESVNLSARTPVTGTLEYLYAGIDALASSGHEMNSVYMDAVNSIVGVPITTSPSESGKKAGYYYSKNKFVTLDQMGDGVAEMLSLIVELCLEEGKIFILEEPETNIHPYGIKKICELIRNSSEKNQFIIATHSNIVLRELGDGEGNKIFKITKLGDDCRSPSIVSEVEDNPVEHINLLRELGYEFADLGLHEGWLFLEESTAESVFKEVLIPHFAPKLASRLRTFSAGGASKIEPSVSDFMRLITFVHLQPQYQGRLWVRADGDKAGLEAIEAVQSKFKSLDAECLATFKREQFENYYPAHFDAEVAQVLAISDRNERRKSKIALMKRVLEWTKNDGEAALEQWKTSAAEPIALLKKIQKTIGSI